MSVLVQEAPLQVEQPALRPVPRELTQERYPLPPLPQLDRSWGYKTVLDEKTGEYVEEPLTLLDLLYPTGEEFPPDQWLEQAEAATQARRAAEARAEAKAERAEVEAKARAEAEANLAAVTARLRELEARYGVESTK